MGNRPAGLSVAGSRSPRCWRSGNLIGLGLAGSLGGTMGAERVCETRRNLSTRRTQAANRGDASRDSRPGTDRVSSGARCVAFRSPPARGHCAFLCRRRFRKSSIAVLSFQWIESQFMRQKKGEATSSAGSDSLSLLSDRPSADPNYCLCRVQRYRSLTDSRPCPYCL